MLANRAAFEGQRVCAVGRHAGAVTHDRRGSQPDTASLHPPKCRPNVRDDGRRPPRSHWAAVGHCASSSRAARSAASIAWSRSSWTGLPRDIDVVRPDADRFGEQLAPAPAPLDRPRARPRRRRPLPLAPSQQAAVLGVERTDGGEGLVAGGGLHGVVMLMAEAEWRPRPSRSGAGWRQPCGPSGRPDSGRRPSDGAQRVSIRGGARAGAPWRPADGC